MFIKLSVVTNFTESQNQFIGALLNGLIAMDDRGDTTIRVKQGAYRGVDGPAWSRAVTYELQVCFLAEPHVAAMLDKACAAYEAAEGPMFPMSWTLTQRRQLRARALAN